MSLVFAGVCSHAPGITGRAHMAEPRHRATRSTRPSGGMARGAARPARCAHRRRGRALRQFLHEQHAGLRDGHGRPLRRADRGPAWLGIERHRIPGNAALSRAPHQRGHATVDVAYAEEWKFDHGIMVPLHFLTPEYDLPVIPVNINCQGPPLTPLHRAWAFGEALRRAGDRRPSASPSSAPAASRTGRRRPTPARSTRLGTVNCWRAGRATTTRCTARLQRRGTYRDAGQGGFEIRTFIAMAAAARGRGQLQHYTPIPIFSVGCTVATMDIE